MKNLYSEPEAKKFVSRYRRQKCDADLALRLYTSQLLGADRNLVRHGGGNTPLKTSTKPLGRRVIRAMHIKGSGWNLDQIEPAGLPLVDLGQLQDLENLTELSDADMLTTLRAALIDPSAPSPSVETLLHAFLPHKYIDHTHADAVLALTNQPGGEALCKEVFGERLVVLPYAMSGFDLAKRAAFALRDRPKAHGLIVLKHGIFTFGDTAKQAYGRMIRFVTLAERRIKKGRKKIVAAKLATSALSVAELAPMLRGAVSEPDGDGDFARMVLDFRTSREIRKFVDGANLARYGQAGPVTPDHVIWTKPRPLILKPALRSPGQVTRAVDDYAAAYEAYFRRHNRRHKGSKTARDLMPRVALAPGKGLFGIGRSALEAKIAADLAETNAAIILAAETLGRYAPASEADLFDIEYWTPEAAKLGAGFEPVLGGQIVLVTGGGSGIGRATAELFAANGAAVAILDLDQDGATDVAGDIDGVGIGCDVTRPDQVRAAFDQVAGRFGGVDIVVSNAGAAWQGEIGTVSDEVLRQSFELNFFAHQTVAQNAVRIMRAQGLGGCLLFNTSKQAVNPGADFGPYGLPKAATLFLVRQYAVDHGKDGIRSNGVNADRVRSGLLTDKMIKSRAKARNLSAADYLAGNLLGEEVTADDVAQAFLDLALARKTTAAILTVDGGNIAAALR